jgi:hypothetical protein
MLGPTLVYEWNKRFFAHPFVWPEPSLDGTSVFQTQWFRSYALFKRKQAKGIPKLIPSYRNVSGLLYPPKVWLSGKNWVSPWCGMLFSCTVAV